MQPKLIIEQKITPFVNKYAVYGVTEAGIRGDLLAFAQQKRLAFKEKVTFYSDEQKTQVAFTFRAEKVFDIHGYYFVEDADGVLLGSFKKEFRHSLINSTWKICDAQKQPMLTVKESNTFLALLRRFGGLIPFVGDLINIIVLFFKYHFVFISETTGQPVGRYQKTTLFRDHYALSMDADTYTQHDWRVLAAMGVGLDALQSR